MESCRETGSRQRSITFGLLPRSVKLEPRTSYECPRRISEEAPVRPDAGAGCSAQEDGERPALRCPEASREPSPLRLAVRERRGAEVVGCAERPVARSQGQ